MNLRWLVLFSVVAEHMSFTKAATRLNVAQPWISAQIRKLELEVGVSLFERTKHGIGLTAEGSALLPLANQVAEGSRRFRDMARTMGNLRSKVVRLGSHVATADLQPVHAFNLDFQRKYSAFSIEVERGSSAELLRALDSGTADCVVCRGPIEDPDGAYESMEVARFRPYILAPRGKTREAIKLDGVAVEVASVEPSTTLFDALRALGANVKTAPESSREAVEYAVRNRKAVAALIEGNPEIYASDGDIIAQPLDVPEVEILMVRPANREAGRAARGYWAFAKARFAAH